MPKAITSSTATATAKIENCLYTIFVEREKKKEKPKCKLRLQTIQNAHKWLTRHRETDLLSYCQVKFFLQNLSQIAVSFHSSPLSLPSPSLCSFFLPLFPLCSRFATVSAVTTVDRVLWRNRFHCCFFFFDFSSSWGDKVLAVGSVGRDTRVRLSHEMYKSS